jgi:PAS domain S-box-containing protein
LKTQSYIRLLFVVLLIAAASVVATLFQNAQRTNATFNLVNHTHEVIGAINDLNATVLSLETGVRGFVISGNNTFIKDFAAINRSLQQQSVLLHQLTKDNPAQQEHFHQLQQHIEAKVLFQQKILTAYNQSPQDALHLIASLQGKTLSDSVRTLLRYMERHEQQLLQQRISDNRETTHNRFVFSVFVIAVSLVAVFIALQKIARANRLRAAAEQKARENEVRYHSMVENSAVVMYRAHLDGQIDYVSRKCTQLTGYEAEELKSKPITFLIQEDWQQRVAQWYGEQIENKVHETLYAFPIRTKSGATKWVEQSMVLLLDEQGRPNSFQSVVKEITEKWLAEEALKSAAQEIEAKKEEYQFRMQSILDNIPMIVYIKDLEGRYLMANRRFRETFLLTDEQILGKENHEVFADDDLARVLAAVDMQVKNKLQPIEFEDLINTSEGDRHMLVTKFPLLDKNNKIFAVCGVDKDITEMVASRQQLIDARLRAERAERLQEEFLANMSHEIRTPMNGIIGMTNLLDESALSEDQKEFVQLIKYSSNTLLALINDILDLSKIKAGRMSVEEIPFSVREVVEEVAATFRVQAATNNVAVVTTINGSLPQMLQGDRHKLVQVLNNLLGNAVKFTAQGRISVSVSILHQDDANMCLGFRVADTGMGIAPEFRDYIFESFAQTGNDTLRLFGGTGLGLTITKRLVELQGGSIGVESRTGEGSVFYFDIPYKYAAMPEVQQQLASAANTADKSMLAGKKILLVEDNLINQKVTLLLLQKVGLIVTIAGNGKEAVERLEAGERFDLVIMDLQMPEMNGLQATAYIRNKLKLQLPIIAMTASALRNERERCFEMGMNEYLTKPFVPAELFRQLCRFLDCGQTLQLEPAQKNEIQPNELYNLAYLHELEDDGYLAETLTLFLETTPGQLEELRQSVLHEQWSEVHARAHKLKSSFGMLQIASMLELAAAIEAGAKNRKELETMTNKTTRLQQQYELIQPMLEAERQKVSYAH